MGTLTPGVVVVNVTLADGRTVPVYPGQPFPEGIATGEMERLTRLGAVTPVEKPKRVKG